MKNIIKRLKSKTYWLGLGTLLLGSLETAQATGAISTVLDGQARGWLTIVVAVMIFLLRELTKSSISEK